MAQEPSEAFRKSEEIVIEKLGMRIDVACLGVNVADFLEGKVNIHDIRDKGDKVVEWKVWLAALFILKNHLGYSKPRVIEKFSWIPGYVEETTKLQVLYYWDKI